MCFVQSDDHLLVCTQAGVDKETKETSEATLKEGSHCKAVEDVAAGIGVGTKTTQTSKVAVKGRSKRKAVEDVEAAIVVEKKTKHTRKATVKGVSTRNAVDDGEADLPDDVSNMLIATGMQQYSNLFKREGCLGLWQLVQPSTLVEMGVKRFHAEVIAQEARAKSAGDVDCTGHDEGPVKAAQNSEDFRPGSWQVVHAECAQFDEYKAKTGQGRYQFIKDNKKGYSETALRRWQTQWLPCVLVDGEIDEDAHACEATPKGLKKYKALKAALSALSRAAEDD